MFCVHIWTVVDYMNVSKIVNPISSILYKVCLVLVKCNLACNVTNVEILYLDHE